MSRSRTRARNRRAQLEKLRAEFEEKRQDPEALADLLHRLAGSQFRVWAVARPSAGAKPLDETERAMIAQSVAPHLAGMTPGSVHHRHGLSGMPSKTAWDVGLGSQVAYVRFETDD
jgi:hypothetical protein